MKKVTVKRIIKVGERPYFKVICDGITSGIICFEVGAPSTSIYNEEINRKAAMELAAKLESGGEDTEEIIYQTPETN